jgi:hypothetical protein
VGVEAAFIVVNVPVLDRLAPLVGSDDNPRTLIGREFALGNNIAEAHVLNESGRVVSRNVLYRRQQASKLVR